MRGSDSAVAQPLLVGVAILGDNRGDALGMFQRNPQADGSAVIEDIDRETLKPDIFGEAADRLSKVFEGVFELISGGRSD